MNFISYAQNFEDVILWRALKNVENGFYIDVGAQDPVVDSVSYAFYKHGWKGVSVEPTQQYSANLRRARPDEVVKQVAIGNQSGSLVFFEFPDTGLSTADQDIADRHKSAGYDFIKTEVQILSLDNLFDEFFNEAIHWMKIDVEGWEKLVLESWEISAARPWILVVEATAPLGQELTHNQWEHLVVAKGYQFAYFDGLNRFYVHENHLDLVEKLNIPPNVFDDFCLNGTASHSFCQLIEDREQKAGNLARQLQEQRAEVAEARAQEQEQRAEARTQEQKRHIDALEAECSALRQSVSWRITAPLRFAAGLTTYPLRTLRSGANVVIHHAISATESTLSRLMAAVLRRPQLSHRINSWLLRYPSFYRQLMGVARRGGVVPSAPVYSPPAGQVDLHTSPDLANITPRARQIYADLQTAVENNQRTN